MRHICADFSRFRTEIQKKSVFMREFSENDVKFAVQSALFTSKKYNSMSKKQRELNVKF